MPTSTQLKNDIDTVIRQKVAANSITTDNVADILDSLVDFVDGPIITLTDAPTVVFDAELGSWAKVTIAGNRTFDWQNFTNGMSGIIKVVQDGVGGRTIDWDTAIEPDGGIVLDTAAGGVTIVGYIVIDGEIRLFNEGSGFVGLPVIQTLSPAEPIVFNANLGLWAKVTIAANRTMSWVNFANGMSGVIKVIQDSVGGRAIDWDTAIEPTGGIVLNDGANEVTFVGYIVMDGEIRLFNEGGGGAGLPEISKGISTAAPTGSTTILAGEIATGILVRCLDAQTGFKVGTTAGADDIVSEQDLDATTGAWHAFPMLFKSQSNQTFYITAPSGSGVEYQIIRLV